MKKTIVLVLCLLIAVFALTSCNNDMKAPNENGNGDSVNPGSSESKIVGDWSYTDNNGNTQYYSFLGNGNVTFKTNSETGVTHKYNLEENNAYIIVENSEPFDFSYTLNESENTISVNGPELNGKFVTKGSANGIYGTWNYLPSDESDNKVCTYTITEVEFTSDYYRNEKLYRELKYSITDSTDGKLSLTFTSGKMFIATYNEADDTLILDEGIICKRQ